MAGLAGVFMRRGAQADATCLERMAAAAPHRSVDGTWAWHEGPFAAIRQRTVLTPEDTFEREPVVNHEPHAVVAFDGRLDNRGELAAALAISPSELRGMSDARLTLRAWLRWGDATPLRLLGDFAFVAWDRAAGQVCCATDSFGVRPLHYYLSETVFVFATELAQLFVHPLVPRRADERAAGELLLGDPRSAGRTLFADVRRLPHAHVLLVGERRERLVRYWAPEPTVVRRASDAEYAEAFGEQFDRAVSVRMRSRGPVGAHLSGGLDSSSVVVTAAHLNAAQKKFTTFSLDFHGVPDADERRYFQSVVRHAAVAGVTVAPPRFDPAEIRLQARRRQYVPDFPNSLGAVPMRLAMADRNIRVCLSGAGGDIGLAGSYFYYADLLRHGCLGGFVRRYRDVAAFNGARSSPRELLQVALWPALPAVVRRTIRPIVRRLRRTHFPDWLDRSLVRRTSLDESPASRESSPASSIANADIIAGYDDGLTHLVHDLYELGSSQACIYERHPFLDRGLVECVLTMPDDQRWKNGQTKFVLRQALGSRLPSIVRDRPDRTKADFSHLVDEALDALGGRRFFERLSIDSAGWTVPGALGALYDRMQRSRAAGNHAYRELAWQLWCAAALEIWHSEVFGPTARRSSWSSAASDPTTTETRRLACTSGSHIASPA